MQLSRDFSPELESLLAPLRRHVSAYRFAWALAIVCFVIAWNRGLALLYAVVALCVAALVLSHLLARFNLRGVEVRRERMIAAAPGEAPVLRYRLRAPGQRHFLLVEEPDLPGVAPTLVAQLDRAADVERELQGLHRGVYRLQRLIVRTGYPFGLLSRQRELRAGARELIVHPRWHECPRLPDPRAQRARRSVDERVLSRHRGHDEFAGVRELRPGEGVRHVHWRASARQDRLLVKEYDARDTPAMLIVLPQQPGFECGEKPASAFEYAIEIAVSLARAAARAGYPVHVSSDGKRPLRLQVAPHTADSRPMLDWFARVESAAATPAALAIERALQTVANCGWLVTFRHAGERLRVPARGGCWLDFVFERDSFHAPGEEAPAPRKDVFAQGVRYRVNARSSLAGLLAC